MFLSAVHLILLHDLIFSSTIELELLFFFPVLQNHTDGKNNAHLRFHKNLTFGNCFASGLKIKMSVMVFFLHSVSP